MSLYHLAAAAAAAADREGSNESWERLIFTPPTSTQGL
jgi:hypothetical protein